MELKEYREMEASGHDGIRYLRNEVTGHQLVLKRTDIESGLREIKAYKRMPNSPLLGYRMENNGVLLMLTRHEGQSLHDWIESGEKKKKIQLLQNLSQVLESALASLNRMHNVGLCHGHITPKKIIVSDDYRVNLIGFGESHTEEGKGNVEFNSYLAPELFFTGEVDPFLADYYSLGKSLKYVLVDESVNTVLDVGLVERISKLCSIIPKNRKFR